MPSVTFYYDLGSPYAYLAALRIPALLPEPVIWQPVLVGALFKLTGRSSWARGDQGRREEGMAEIERRARSYGLPPLRWPDPWPGDYLLAMRAATFARQVGLEHEFAGAAFGAAFMDGRDLSQPEVVLDAARAAGLDPEQVNAATADPEIKQALRTATDAAHERGVFGVPTVTVGSEVFWGDDKLEEVARRLHEPGPTGPSA